MNTALPVFLEEGADEVLLTIASSRSTSRLGASPRTPRILVPHCNCVGANEARRGTAITWGQANGHQATYQMVPTKTKDSETCDFCGYFVFLHEARPSGVGRWAAHR